MNCQFVANPRVLRFPEDSDEIFEAFKEQGFALVEGLISENVLEEVERYVQQLIYLQGQRAGLFGENSWETLDIESLYEALALADPGRSGAVYRAGRMLPPLHAFASSKLILDLVGILLQTDVLSVNPFTALRMDRRADERYLFDWHQDYPYTQGSEGGTVLWGSLRDLDESDGGIALIPGSHKRGIQPVRIVDPNNQMKNGAAAMAFADSSWADSQMAYHFRVKKGQLLVFSNLLVHRSVPMERGSVRWSFQVRHGSFDDHSAVNRLWPQGVLLGSPFQEVHPESVES